MVLLDRGARSFALTPAAETLLTDARKLLEFCDAMTARVRSAAAGLPLRIGYSPSLAGDFLPFAIESFGQLHPGVRVSLHDASSVEMQQSLLAGKLDLMVTVPCGATDSIYWTTLRECGWQLAVSPRHRLASHAMVKPSDLDGERLLLYDREQYPDYWSRVTGLFQTARHPGEGRRRVRRHRQPGGRGGGESRLCDHRRNHPPDGRWRRARRHTTARSATAGDRRRRGSGRAS